MFGKKQKMQLHHDVKVFSDTVVSLMDGIHKLDQFLEQLTSKKICAYSDIAFVGRSLEDLLSICHIYKNNRFFHTYNIFEFNEYTENINQACLHLVQTAHLLDKTVRGYNVGVKMFKRIVEDDSMEDDEDCEEIKRKLQYLEQKVKELHNDLIDDIVVLRTAMFMIRKIVSRDYMSIQLGVNLEEQYMLDEKRMRRELKAMIRFYEKPLQKKKRKEESNNA